MWPIDLVYIVPFACFPIIISRLSFQVWLKLWRNKEYWYYVCLVCNMSAAAAEAYWRRCFDESKRLFFLSACLSCLYATPHFSYPAMSLEVTERDFFLSCFLTGVPYNIPSWIVCLESLVIKNI